MIKNLDKLTAKHKKKYVIWILKNLEKVSTGIYYLGNKRMDYFNAIKYFANMRQGTLEGYGRNIKWERLTIETLILAGGRHVLCITDIREM